MDLSVTLSPHQSAPMPSGVASLADLFAAAEERRGVGANRMVESTLWGQNSDRDMTYVLARALVPGNGGRVGAVLLGGSFNPAIARQLMVGEIR